MLEKHYYEGKIEAGCDEAGRGCLAGSVYAAAVILPADYDNPALNDSKQLSEKQRYELRTQIERDAIAWAVGVVTPEEIDRINILKASFLAMHRALDQLQVRPEAIIVDGNRFTPYYEPHSSLHTPPSTLHPPPSTLHPPHSSLHTPHSTLHTPHTCIIKGDGKYQSIAAASILAKTYRDDYMDRLAEEYPMYDWQSNKGYPTKKHREALRQYGPSPYHRMSYNLLGTSELSLPFDL